jgi:transposase
MKAGKLALKAASMPAQQESLPDRERRCACFVYNYMLRLRSDTWYWRQTRIGIDETAAALDVILGLPEYDFLATVSIECLALAINELDRDFSAFYAGSVEYPIFRSAPHAAGAGTIEFHLGYPTSSRCADCGYFVERAPHSLQWTCPDCGVIHETEKNTARNIAATDLAIQKNEKPATD